MSNLILNNQDIFRAERLFTERVSSPISTSSFYRSGNDFYEDGRDAITFNKRISRSLNATKMFRIVKL